MSGQKLYLHKTDGGAEYLCTVENDIGTAVVRLDGGPVLVGNGCMLANAADTLGALKGLANIATHPKATRTEIRMIADEARVVIRKATGTSA